MSSREQTKPTQKPQPEAHPLDNAPEEVKAQVRVNPRAEAERARARGVGRGERIPLGAPHFKTAVKDYGDQTDGYEIRWIKDSGDRVQRAIRGGWEPVYHSGELQLGDGEYNPDQNTWVARPAGTNEGGQPMKSFLMKIKKEWYEEDQKAKRRQVEEIDKAIKSGKINEEQKDQNHYVKKADYRINQQI